MNNEVQIQTLTEVIAEWEASVVALKAAKETELQLRNKLASQFETKKGMQTLHLNDGSKLKCAYSEKTTVDSKVLGSILSTIENNPNFDRSLIPTLNMCIKYTPAIDSATFKKAPPTVQSVLENAMTTKLSSTPTISYELPKLGESAELDEQILNSAIAKAK